ncbi:hypothetical protein DAI22_02g330250 [Oryza sativa Japonica Group]|nr:hypothetical protein DAI22_02g330250 [Oryza sativa Japonica Group]
MGSCDAVSTGLAWPSREHGFSPGPRSRLRMVDQRFDPQSHPIPPSAPRFSSSISASVPRRAGRRGGVGDLGRGWPSPRACYPPPSPTLRSSRHEADPPYATSLHGERASHADAHAHAGSRAPSAVVFVHFVVVSPACAAEFGATKGWGSRARAATRTPLDRMYAATVHVPSPRHLSAC